MWGSDYFLMIHSGIYGRSMFSKREDKRRSRVLKSVLKVAFLEFNGYKVLISIHLYNIKSINQITIDYKRCLKTYKMNIIKSVQNIIMYI